MGASFCGANGRKARGHGPLLRGPHTEKAGGKKVPVRLLCIIRVLGGGGYPVLSFSLRDRSRLKRLRVARSDG
jgi:hypothetical protein